MAGETEVLQIPEVRGDFFHLYLRANAMLPISFEATLILFGERFLTENLRLTDLETWKLNASQLKTLANTMDSVHFSRNIAVERDHIALPHSATVSLDHFQDKWEYYILNLALVFRNALEVSGFIDEALVLEDDSLVVDEVLQPCPSLREMICGYFKFASDYMIYGDGKRLALQHVNALAPDVALDNSILDTRDQLGVEIFTLAANDFAVPMPPVLLEALHRGIFMNRPIAHEV